MPEDKEPKTVDIDTSGPGADVELPEEKVTETVETVEPEKQVEEKVEETPVEEKQETKIEEKQETKIEEKQETKEDEKPKEELEQYSEGVQKRIAKLTKKWREAERQREAALDYAKGVQTEHQTLKNKMAKLEPSYVTAVENRVRSGLDAAKATLMKAREAGDINAEVEAQKEIARLGMEEVRVNTLKNKLSEQKEQVVQTPSLDQRLQTPPSDPKAEEWAEKNEWIGKDSAMTYTAFDLHKKLVD